MAINWKIKVDYPTLTQGMAFQVRYRQAGSNTWNNFTPNPTTNEFTIYNLPNADYEAEIKTVCVNGDLSNPAYHSTTNTSNVLAAAITWDDDTDIVKSGAATSITVKVASLDYNTNDPLISQKWEVWNGTSWIEYADKTTDSQVIDLAYNLNKIRLKIQAVSGQIAYSNTLQYSKAQNRCFIGFLADGTHPPGGRIVYIDENNEEVTEEGIYSNSGTVSVYAISIIQTIFVTEVECE